MPKANAGLSAAKKSKNDEFYTQYEDIQKEINAYLDYNPNTFRNKTILLPCDDPEWSNFTKFFAQNFEMLGLKKLISTSYATDSKNINMPKDYQFSIEDFLTNFEKNSPQYDASNTASKGKIFILDKDVDKSGHINIEDLQWSYLEGDGDFRSDEVKKLRDEADIIITNPPFSLFREFLAWVMDEKKQFMIIGNINCITYKEVFPLIMDNKIWLGNGMGRWISGFIVPEKYELYGTEARIENGRRIVATNNCLWLTNIPHGKRKQVLERMTIQENLKFNKALIKKLQNAYQTQTYPTYDNYDAIEVPYTEAIPKDYKGVMGVPITFLDKYNPEQFQILGATQRGCHDKFLDTKKYDDYFEMRQDGTKTGYSGNKTNENANIRANDGKKNYFINNEGDIVQSTYQRIFIRYTQKWIESHPNDFKEKN